MALFANGLGTVSPPVRDGLNSCDPNGICRPDLSNVILRRTVTAPIISIGGITLAEEDVLFSGLVPLFVALYQVNLRIPEGIDKGEVPIVIRMGGVESRGYVTIRVE